MPLIREITQAERLFIGDISLVYEYFDPADREVMLVVCDPSLHWLRRHRPYYLKDGAILHLPNGVRIVLQRGSTQKRARLAIINPEKLPIKLTKASWTTKASTSRTMPTEVSPAAMLKCATSGCFNTAYGSELCDECLDGRTPAKRGPVRAREPMNARLYGGEDLAVTRDRLKQNGQPDSGLY